MQSHLFGKISTYFNYQFIFSLKLIRIDFNKLSSYLTTFQIQQKIYSKHLNEETDLLFELSFSPDEMLSCWLKFKRNYFFSIILFLCIHVGNAHAAYFNQIIRFQLNSCYRKTVSKSEHYVNNTCNKKNNMHVKICCEPMWH